MTWRPEWEGEQRPGGFSFGPRGPAGWTTTKALLVAMAVVFVLSLLMDSLDGRWVVRHLGLNRENWYWLTPFFTYLFVHDINSLGHLVMNALMIWFMGSSVEAILGRRRYLTLFFGAGVVGAVAYLVGLVFAGYDSYLIGASGAALGLVFFAAWETPNRQIIFMIFPLRLRTLAYILLAFDLYPVLRNLGQPGGGVAHHCHLGGALFGYLYWKYRPDPFSFLSGARQRVQEHSAAKQVRNAAAADAEMDRILQKINAEGMPSLTKAERKFLQERSRSLRGGRED